MFILHSFSFLSIFVLSSICFLSLCILPSNSIHSQFCLSSSPICIFSLSFFLTSFFSFPLFLQCMTNSVPSDYVDSSSLSPFFTHPSSYAQLSLYFLPLPIPLPSSFSLSLLFFAISSFSTACLTGLSVVGKHVIGLNPLQLNKLNTVMDTALRGHPYVKSAIGTYTLLFFIFV